MSASHDGEQLTAAQGPEATLSHEEALRKGHTARGRSALDRAAALCRYLGIEVADAESVPRTPAAKAANAVRLSARALAQLADGSPDPAADARCARNAAAAAAVVADLARSRGGDGAPADAAHRAAVTASLAAGAAAGRTGMGRDAALNTTADAAEAAAVSAARDAGWV
ncbi:hypothetical protein [Streptomyces gilvosporeus]|uniref:Uncharacterized protein n=1 Tax=Streptomyces gilvosporeus TaxID=553510 RepID=A0A1V0TUG1_9ACTN|nr:hypothetical protein [Streptomyces gilvosporeus]ARF56595.1 hypothetical protein B1H19_22655 [Streptomyces gilvosporeus]